MSRQELSVCMFSNLYPPIVSGSAMQSSALARELSARGCRVVVITARVDEASLEHEVADGVRIYRLRALRFPRLAIAMNFPWLSLTFLPGNLRRIEQILREHRPDVLHLHNHMFDLALSAAIMRRRLHIPLVVTIHTVIKHARGIYNLVLVPADRWFLKRAVIAQADAILCPDVNVEAYVKQAFGERRHFIIPYGISPPGRPSGDAVAALRSRYRLDGKRVILSLGHVHAIRNRRDLIEAMPDVLKAVPNAVLLVVGAVATETPGALARRLGVERSVVFTGPVPHAEVSALLALAEMEGHWLNQETPEKTSLGVATLEAMAAGKTALAVANENTHGAGVIRAGENIVLVEPGQPRKLAQTVVTLLSDEARRTAIGDCARETLQTHFSWDSVCARTIEAYTEVMRSFPRRRIAEAAR